MEFFGAEIESSSYSCAFCNSVNDTFVDPSGGEYQQYVEDCQVCCSPNILTASFDHQSGGWYLRAEPE